MRKTAAELIQEAARALEELECVDDPARVEMEAQALLKGKTVERVERGPGYSRVVLTLDPSVTEGKDYAVCVTTCGTATMVNWR